MDANELAVLNAAIRNALTNEEATAVALDTLGWRDALSSEPRAAVTVLFTALGDLNANAPAVDDVMLYGFGVDAPHSGASLALPAFDRWDPPGAYEDGVVALDGLALSRAVPRDTVVVPA